MGQQNTGFSGSPGAGYNFGGNQQVNAMLGQYAVPTPTELEYAGQFSRNELNRAAGAQPMPTFEDMFNRYIDVSNREAARSAASINEAMGARGARYGSDLTRAQADLRQRQTQDLMQKASEYSLGLEQQRQGLMNVAGQGLIGVGGAKMAGWQAGLGMLRQDAAAAAAPAPMVGPAAGWAGQWGPGTQAAV
jgi:hypothetical protein